MTAAAQDPNQDQEYRAVETRRGRTETEFLFESEAHTYNNLDFRALDETSDQAILDSDDRDAFAFTGIGASLGYNVADDLHITFGASHRGVWGNDQVGNINAYGGLVYVTALSMDWTPLTVGGDEENPLLIRVGRQFYEIGGTAGPEFILADVIDGVRIDIPIGRIGRIETIPFSIFTSAGENTNANFFNYIGQSTQQIYGFRGDHLTRRHGANLVLDGLTDGLDLRAHAFYTDLAAIGSGSDISYGGMLGNFSDNDWVLNYGLRGGYERGAFAGWAEFDGSTGIDRQELVAPDIDTTGFAYGAGVRVDTTKEDDSGPGFQLDWFEAWGPTYTADGMQFSHGYVSMKAQQVGGLLANRYLGWHPTAYVGTFGIDDSPQDKDRKSGTRSIHLGAFQDFGGKVRIDLDGWFMQDTGITALNVARLDEITPPYGYSRAEFAAEERLGRILGIEADARVTGRVNEHLSFTGTAGVLLPGSFYDVRIARTAGDQLGGDEMAWATSLGTRVEF